MAVQSKDLRRLNILVLGLGFLLLAVSASGFIVLDVYLLSNVSPTRLSFLDRTMSYLQTAIKACIALRHWTGKRSRRGRTDTVTAQRPDCVHPWRKGCMQ